MNKQDAAIGWTTAPSHEEARRICEALLEKKQVACAQISSPIESHYRWNGKLEWEKEYRITLKFSMKQAHAIDAWLQKNHSYDNPQWIWVQASGGAEPYLQWMTEA